MFGTKADIKHFLLAHDVRHIFINKREIRLDQAQTRDLLKAAIKLGYGA